MAMFIMLGVREFPRSTLVYLFLFDYWDTFLPFFSCCVTQDKEYTLKQLLDLVRIFFIFLLVCNVSLVGVFLASII